MSSITKNLKPKTKKNFLHCRLEDSLKMRDIVALLGNKCYFELTEF